MKQENFTPKRKTRIDKFISYCFLSALLLLGTFTSVSAQCPLGCNNSVQISLDADCSVEVTPDMVLEGQGTNGCAYTVQVLGSNDQPIPGSPVVTGAYIGETLTVKVSLGANSCWGTITIEDKLPPMITCNPDLTVSCYGNYTVIPPIAIDNCDGNIPVDVISDDIADLDCDNEFSACRTIIYRATDESGNQSAICEYKVFFSRIGLGDIVFPPNKDGVEDPVLECDNVPVLWDDNGNGYPDPEETGTPTTTDGFNIFPNNSYCELNATFSDQQIDICESSFKVLRTWVVLDWCTGELAEDFQIIKVVDNEHPIVTCVPDDPDAVPADPYNCLGEWDVPDPIVIFDCSSTTYTVQYLLADNNGEAPENGLYIDTNVKTNFDGSYTITDLPLGRTWIRYTIEDACGNVEFCFTEVDVFDDVPPVPVCDEFTVATLTNSGYAHIFAETFDDLSHDNCSDVSFEVRRMTSGCGINTNTWGPYTEFCCDDIGKEIMVSLRVTDEAGNSNTCMVIVNVQDKLDPTIECPPNITVDCGTDISNPDNTGGIATGEDNCGSVDLDMSDSGSLNDCGVGTIFRTFIVTDAGGRTASCSQRITVVDNSPFNGGQISWPPNRTLSGCMDVDTDPSSTGTPGYPTDLCSQVADTYEDQVFEFVDDVCFKILRTWTVIDWCTFDQNNPQNGGIYQYTQVIKVNNTVAPVFTSCPSTLTVEAFGENCNGFVDLVQEATDDCTPDGEIQYTLTIDEDNDGSIDDFLQTNDASGTYPVGTHKLTFTAEDQCGNQTTCMITLRVLDRKNPTPYCISDITTVIMPSTGEIAIWARDYDLGSTDNCPGELQFSFSSNTVDTGRVFTCDDLGLNDLEMWVTDASGNQEFCTVTINIQANDGCDGSRISGIVSTSSDENVANANVSLMNMTTYETLEYMTNETGRFSFQGITEGLTYQLSVEKDEDHGNGVNTLDLVMIQRHLLELDIFDDPYKVIASDINGSESITVSDLLALRKLILGINTEFENNNSWRFVNSGQDFGDVTHPFPFLEQVTVSNFNDIDNDNDFMAVKIGDVNYSATTNLDGNKVSETRSGKTITLTVDNAEFTNGDVVEVPVTAENFESLLGFQFTMEMNGLELVDVTSGALEMTSSNVATFEKEDALTMSWNDVSGVSADENEVLFTLSLRAKTNGTIDNNIEITSAITSAEAYTQSLEVADVTIDVRDTETVSTLGFELYQNNPNPFDGVTTIPFNLPKAGTVSVRVYDITGKVIFSNSRNYTKGMNEIILDKSDLNAQGVLYYQVEYNGEVTTRKMIAM